MSADAVARQLWDAFQECYGSSSATNDDKTDDDIFCGLFIYDGVRSEPPSEDDAIVQAMQTADSTWIVFADDGAVQQCADCAPPFVDCVDGSQNDIDGARGGAANDSEGGAGASFCHLRFPLTARGTLDAVRFMIDDYVGHNNNPSTAFICAYSRSNILDDQSEPQAHVIGRFVLGGGKDEDEITGTRSSRSHQNYHRRDALTDRAPTVEDLSKPTPRKTYRRVWIIAIGLALLAAIIAIVTLVVLRQKKQKQQRAQQKTREAALIAQSLSSQQPQQQEQMQQDTSQAADPVVVRIAPE